MAATIAWARVRWAPVLFVGLLGFFGLACSSAPPRPKPAPAQPPRMVLREGTKEEWATVVRLLLPLLYASGVWTGPADGCAIQFGVQVSNAINVGIGPHAKCKFFLVITEGALATLPPDELQAALAHELGHLQLGHVAARQQRRAAEKGMREQIIHQEGTVGGAALDREYRAYDRAEEDAADHYGFDLVVKVIGRERACQAEVGLLERLVKVKSSSEIWRRTHPNPTDRVKAVQEECAAAPEPGR